MSRAFSLIEVLIAILILGIGVISITSLFPAGIAQQRQTTDEVMGAIVASNALAIIRSKVSPSDFGTFEEFNQFVPLFTIPGDWPWIRPGFILGDDGATSYDDRGAIDIFSSRRMRARTSPNQPPPNLPFAPLDPPNLLYASEFPDGLFGFNGEPLFGAPFSRAKWENQFLVPPEFIITQAERYYPMQSQIAQTSAGDALPPSRPQYVWDCMFRRFGGRVMVAVFVYRVTPEGGMESFRYRVPARIAPAERRDLSPMPDVIDLTAAVNAPVAESGAWDAYDPRSLGGDPDDDAIDTWRFVLGNAGGRVYNPFNRAEYESYQAAGQWVLDQNNATHRIVAHSRVDDDPTKPLRLELRRLISPVPTREVIGTDGLKRLTMPYLYVNQTAGLYQVDTGLSEVFQNIVTHLWFVPTQVGLDENGDGTEELNLTLTPVYVMVREL